MKSFSTVLLAAMFLCPAFAQSLPCTPPCDTGATFIPDGTFAGQNGYTRQWRAYIPAGITNTSNVSVLFYLHGHTKDDFSSPPYNQFWNNNFNGNGSLKKFAVAYGVIGVYLISGPWIQSEAPPIAACTSGSCEWFWDAYETDSYFTEPPGDLAYIQYVMKTLVPSWTSGTTTNYLMGFSDGAFMAEYYAAINPGDIAGLADFSGETTLHQSSVVALPNSAGNVKVYVQHGDDDTIVNYCGGKALNIGYGLLQYPGTDTSFNYWANGMRCRKVIPETALCTGGSPNGVALKTATACAGGSVEAVDIIGGKHTVPTCCGAGTQVANMWEYMTTP